MSILFLILKIMGFTVAAYVFILFLRAVSAKLMTGYWQHQDKEAYNIFKDLP